MGRCVVATPGEDSAQRDGVDQAQQQFAADLVGAADRVTTVRPPLPLLLVVAAGRSQRSHGHQQLDGFDEQGALGEPIGVVGGEPDVLVRGEDAGPVGQVLGGGDVLGVLGRRRAEDGQYEHPPARRPEPPGRDDGPVQGQPEQPGRGVGHHQPVTEPRQQGRPRIDGRLRLRRLVVIDHAPSVRRSVRRVSRLADSGA
jgi:hypothetical protein